MRAGQPWGLLLLLFVPLLLFVTRGLWLRRRRALAAFPVLRALVDELPLLPPSYLVRRKIQQALLGAAFLALALAGADLIVGSADDPPLHAILLVDNQALPQGSGSPAATAAALLAGLRTDDRVQLVRADGVRAAPGLLAPRAAAAALRALPPSVLPAEVERSLARLREAAARRRPALVAIVSARPGLWRERLEAAEAAAWRIVPVARAATPVNYAILDVELLPDLLRRERLSVFCRVGAFARPGERLQPATLSLHDGETVLATRTVALEPGRSAGLVFPDLPVATGLLALSVAPGDSYPFDNTYLSPLRTSAFLKAALVTEGNPALEAALGAVPGLDLATLPPARAAEASRREVAIFDRVPVERGASAFLAVAPPGPVPGLARRGEIDHPVLIEADGTNPLLNGVQFAGLEVRRLTVFVPQAGVEVVARAGGYPLVLAGRAPTGQRFALLAFDPVESGWVHDPSYPILTANLVGWAGAGAESGRSAFTVGERLPADLAAGTRSVVDPAGRSRPRPAGGWGALAFDLPGRYRVGGDVAGEIVANHLSGELSRAALADAATPPPDQTPLARRPRRLAAAGPLLWLGLALLGLEAAIDPRATRGRLPA